MSLPLRTIMQMYIASSAYISRRCTKVNGYHKCNPLCRQRNYSIYCFWVVITEDFRYFLLFVLQPAENPSENAVEFARRRLQLGENLYYKMLEKILVSEQQRISSTVSSKTVDFSVGFSHCVLVETMFCVMLTFLYACVKAERKDRMYYVKALSVCYPFSFSRE